MLLQLLIVCTPLQTHEQESIQKEIFAMNLKGLSTTFLFSNTCESIGEAFMKLEKPKVLFYKTKPHTVECCCALLSKISAQNTTEVIGYQLLKGKQPKMPAGFKLEEVRDIRKLFRIIKASLYQNKSFI